VILAPTRLRRKNNLPQCPCGLSFTLRSCVTARIRIIYYCRPPLAGTVPPFLARAAQRFYFTAIVTFIWLGTFPNMTTIGTEEPGDTLWGTTTFTWNRPETASGAEAA
jgi:hypothetical protein